CRTVFAIAGDASNAATPTADRITFRFVLMFNLMCLRVLTRHPSAKFHLAWHKALFHHKSITTLCEVMLVLQILNQLQHKSYAGFSGHEKLFLLRRVMKNYYCL